ncbi:unnamed protein product [Darwinula stevensoni]|uniref:Chitin-binding type-2 domain-containing protein n=1 Tax=Darwinula stevensoni TaxID=69355 RepID=A0A7R9AGT0_9CRUS|nr:unnamed protein product [Darwinula stevensoni]CAG0904179.1 unnamed protein product [Darwinula stevensoni]
MRIHKCFFASPLTMQVWVGLVLLFPAIHGFACRDGDTWRVGDSCDLYWECRGGRPHIRQCDPGLQFHQLLKRCSPLQDLSGCIPSHGGFGRQDMTSTTTPSGPYQCPDDEEAYYPHPKYCYLYYHCEDGYPELLSCYGDTNFDIGDRRCKNPLYVECPPRLPRGTTTPPPGRQDMTSTTTPSGPYQCPDDEEAYYPHPKYCYLYYHCEDGYPELLSCYGDTNFDIEDRHCKNPLYVECPPRLPRGTTTPPPGFFLARNDARSERDDDEWSERDDDDDERDDDDDERDDDDDDERDDDDNERDDDEGSGMR